MLKGMIIVVIPLPVQVILSNHPSGNTEPSVEGRNPFTGSGHSFLTKINIKGVKNGN